MKNANIYCYYFQEFLSKKKLINEKCPIVSLVIWWITFITWHENAYCKYVWNYHSSRFAEMNKRNKQTYLRGEKYVCTMLKQHKNKYTRIRAKAKKTTRRRKSINYLAWHVMHICNHYCLHRLTAFFSWSFFAFCRRNYKRNVCAGRTHILSINWLLTYNKNAHTRRRRKKNDLHETGKICFSLACIVIIIVYGDLCTLNGPTFFHSPSFFS